MSEKLLYEPKVSLKIAGGRPVSEVFLNQFFGTLSLSQIHRFEKLYRDLESEINLINMDSQSFLDQIKNAYKRFQENRALDAFSPMDEKGFRYVHNFLRKSINEIAEKVKKEQMKTLTK